MIVTEEILSHYRSSDGGLAVKNIPARWFACALDAFRTEWRHIPDLSTSLTAKALLEVVVVFAFVRDVPVLKLGRDWLALKHQCGGLLCERQYMVATRLKARPSIYPSLRQIARDGWAAEDGRFSRIDLLASRISNYVAALRRIGVDCECTWRYLTEGVYPIDATDDNLDCLAEDAPKLSDLAVNYAPARYDSNVAIFVLAENND
jgi:hypothetical protein